MSRLLMYPKCDITNNWPTDGYWLRADPVFIQTGSDVAYMQGNADLHISPEEQRQLLHSINQFLQADGMHVYALTDLAWYLHAATPLICQAPPPHQLLQQAIDSDVFTSDAAYDWRLLFTELQMLLYQHPVNQRRRAQGLPEISALWFWQESFLNRLLMKLRMIFSRKTSTKEDNENNNASQL